MLFSEDETNRILKSLPKSTQEEIRQEDKRMARKDLASWVVVTEYNPDNGKSSGTDKQKFEAMVRQERINERDQREWKRMSEAFEKRRQDPYMQEAARLGHLKSERRGGYMFFSDELGSPKKAIIGKNTL